MAPAAIKGEKTLAELAQEYDVHPNQIAAWKAQVMGGRHRTVWVWRRRQRGAPEVDFLAGMLSKAGLLSTKR